MFQWSHLPIAIALCWEELSLLQSCLPCDCENRSPSGKVLNLFPMDAPDGALGTIPTAVQGSVSEGAGLSPSDLPHGQSLTPSCVEGPKLLSEKAGMPPL